MTIQIEPIGTVSSKFKEPKELVFACEKGLKTKSYSTITIDERYTDGLTGLEEFSHIFVIYHLDKAQHVEIMTHPGLPLDDSLKKVGVFASRSQYRPNHLALRLVRIMKVGTNTIDVLGLDAIDGSQVIDIKPYVKGFDRPEEYKTASWYGWLEK